MAKKKAPANAKDKKKEIKKIGKDELFDKYNFDPIESMIQILQNEDLDNGAKIRLLIELAQYRHSKRKTEETGKTAENTEIKPLVIIKSYEEDKRNNS